jgi:gliding motility-associated-like protein
MRKTLPVSKLFLLPILSLSLLFTSTAKAQTDIDFWFAAPEVSTSTQTFDVPIVIRMTTEGAAATVTISQPAVGGMPNQVVNIPANSTQSVDLSTWLAVIESQPANTNLNYGLRIQSTAPITAYYEVVSLACLCNPEIFVLKGKNALGTDFWIPSQNYLDNDQSYNPAPRSSFDIIATENNTTVTITPSNDIIGHLAGVPFNINLNVGQVYSATAVNWQAALHLQGSRVVADKKIAITVKDDLLNGAPYGGCADLAGDQIVPSNIIGSNYIAMNGALNAPDDQLFITATQNNTAITQDGVLQTTINAGQTYQTAVGGASSYIQTSNPAYVYQMSGIGCEVGTAILPQIDCSGSESVSFNRSSPNDLYINVMVQAGGQGNFTVNGLPGVVTAGQFNAVPGTSNQWFAAQVALPVGTYPQGTVITVANSTNSFHLGVLDGSVASGARFGYFSNYGGVPSQATTSTYSLCAGEDILLFADSTDGATYSWTGPNSFSSTVRNPVIASATVGHTGIYYLVVTANGCISPADTLNIVVNGKPAPPIVNYKQYYCTNETFQSFAVSGQNLTYYDAAVGGTASTTQPTINVSIPGTYTVWVTQTLNGCESDRAAIVVTVYPEITPSFSYTINYSCKKDTVQFTNASIGATDYSWYFGDGSPIDHNMNPVHVYDTGVYTVLLVAENPNCKDTISQLINLVHPLKAAFTTSADTICQHSSISFTDASTYATPTSVMPTYQWNFGDGGTSIIQSPVYTFDRVGTYKVSMTITDFVPCNSMAFRTVVVDSMSTLVLSVDTNSVCIGEAIRINGDYTEIGLNSLTWDFGDGIINSEIGNPVTHDYQSYGSYTIKLANDYRVCPDLNAEISVTVRPTPIIALGPDTTICPNGVSYVLHDLINGTNASATWLWSTGATTFSIPVKDANMYWGRVSVDGCSATDSVWVKKDCYIDVPNAFTPDGDGLSDYFFPRQWLSMSVTSFSMIIYNRWGQEVFSTTNIGGRGWDGKFNGVDQPQGVFIYTIDVKFRNGVSEHKQGNVTLLR